MKTEDNKLIIQEERIPRQGWRNQFAAMAKHGDDHLLDPVLATQWEDEDWTWIDL
jgi:hypothetical protein